MIFVSKSEISIRGLVSLICGLLNSISNLVSSAPRFKTLIPRVVSSLPRLVSSNSEVASLNSGLVSSSDARCSIYHQSNRRRVNMYRFYLFRLIWWYLLATGCPTIPNHSQSHWSLSSMSGFSLLSFNSFNNIHRRFCFIFLNFHTLASTQNIVSHMLRLAAWRDAS